MIYLIIYFIQVYVCIGDQTVHLTETIIEGETLHIQCRLGSSPVQGLLIHNETVSTAVLFENNQDEDNSCSHRISNTNLIDSRYVFTCDVKDSILSLELRNVTIKDHSVYFECRTAGKILSVTTLEVQVPLKYLHIDPVHSLTVKKGEVKSVNCTTSPVRPTATVQWYKSHIGSEDKYILQNETTFYTNTEKNLTETRSLVKYIGNPSDNGKILYCMAGNRQGMQTLTSNYLLLNIIYGPVTITFDKNYEHLTLTEGDMDLLITCSANCNPKCNFKWFDINGRSTNGAILKIDVVTKDIRGNYICNAENEYDSVNKTLPVHVKYGPQNKMKFDIDTNVLGVLWRQPTEPVNCISDCNPNCDVWWSHFGEKTLKNSTLYLPELTLSSVEEFICYAANAYGNTSITLTVIVHNFPANITVDQNNTMTVLDGEIVPNITCSADCVPDCDYTWKSRDANYTSGPVLIIGKAVPETAGAYDCIVWNEYGTANITITVHVNYIDPRMINDYVTCQQWTYIILECEAYGFPESFTFHQWQQKFGSQLIRTMKGSTTTDTKSVLKLSYCGYQDTGTYTCRVDNGLTVNGSKIIQSVKANVAVKAQPVISDYEIVEENTELSISVRYYADPDPTETLWFKDGKEVSLSDKMQQNRIECKVNLTFHKIAVTVEGYESTLKIINPTSLDHGTYSLKVTNEKGDAFQYVPVTKVILSKIEYAAIASGLALLLTLPIICVLYFRRKQTRRRRQSMIIEENKKHTVTEKKRNSYEEHGSFEVTEPNIYEAIPDDVVTPYATTSLFGQEMRSLNDVLHENVSDEGYLHPVIMGTFKRPGLPATESRITDESSTSFMTENFTYDLAGSILQ